MKKTLISKRSKVHVINLKVTFERWLNNDFKLSRDLYYRLNCSLSK